MNQLARRLVTVVVVVVGGFLTFRLLDLLMVWSLYSWFFQTIRSASDMPDTLNGAFSIWLVAITLLLLPTFFSILFWKRDTKKVLIVVSAVSAWLVIMYFISLPQEGRFFNTQTGGPMYRYSETPNGKIELFPLGYKFHPRYGTKLKLVTPELVKEMDRREEEAEATREQERQREATEVSTRQEQERQRQLAEAVVAQERERQKQITEQTATREQERQRQLAEAVVAQEREWQSKETATYDPVATIARKFIEDGLAAQKRGTQQTRELSLISRRVSVNRNRTPLEALLATGRKQDTARVVVEAMPKGEGRSIEVFFFTLGYPVNDIDLEKEYESRGLKPADPYSLAAVNESDPSFADNYPNVTHWWENSKGWWCFAAFHGKFSKHDVSVGRPKIAGSDWESDWWFAGLRK